jgi:hypothetical protein
MQITNENNFFRKSKISAAIPNYPHFSVEPIGRPFESKRAGLKFNLMRVKLV